MAQSKDFGAILFHLFRFLLMILYSRWLIAKVTWWRRESDARTPIRLRSGPALRAHSQSPATAGRNGRAFSLDFARSALECDASSHRFRCALSLSTQFGSQRAPLLKTKQPPRGFARRLPLELYPEDVDFSTALPVTVLSILYHPGCRLHHFKLGTHFVDLGGLRFELGCESHYLFLLQLDHYLQLVNFVIHHGLVLGLGTGGTLCGCAGRATTPRCATRRYVRLALARANIPAKVVVRKV